MKAMLRKTWDTINKVIAYSIGVFLIVHIGGLILIIAIGILTLPYTLVTVHPELDRWFYFEYMLLGRKPKENVSLAMSNLSHMHDMRRQIGSSYAAESIRVYGKRFILRTNPHVPYSKPYSAVSTFGVNHEILILKNEGWTLEKVMLVKPQLEWYFDRGFTRVIFWRTDHEGKLLESWYWEDEHPEKRKYIITPYKYLNLPPMDTEEREE